MYLGYICFVILDSTNTEEVESKKSKRSDTLKVFKNFLYNVAYQILIMILPLITAPYIARVLGAELIGVYSYTHSIAYYFVLFAQLGLSVYGNRTIAQVRDNQDKLNYTFSSLYKLQLVIASVSCVIYMTYVSGFAKPDYRVYFFLQFLYVISGVFDINWFYFGIEKFKLTVTRNMVIKILTVVLILLIVKDKNDLSIYIVIMAGGVLLGQLAMWTQLGKYVQFVKTKWKDSFKVFLPVLILFLPTVATSLYRYMDKIMLGTMATMNQLGYYENSEKFISIAMGVINALGTVMIPQMSNLISNGETRKAREYIDKSIEGIYIIASPLAFGLASIATILSVVFYGADFSPCGSIIPVLAMSLLFSAWANVIRTQYLIPNTRDKEYIISMFCGAGANLIINFVLIPIVGAVGAAIGTFFAEAAVAIAHSFFVRKELPLLHYFKLVVPYIFIGGVMFGVVRAIISVAHNSVIWLCSVIAIGMISYGVMLILYLCISRGNYYKTMKVLFEKVVIRKKD